MRQYSESVGEHYIIALIDVEEYCSALHVEEKAKRIQLVPKHSVCLCQDMLIRVDCEVAIPSLTHTGVKHKVALVNELG